MTRLALAFLVCAAGCAPPVELPHGWHVAGGHLRDPQGRAVLLRGANVSDRHKRPPWFDFHELADFERARDEWGMNSVRFIIQWAALEPQPGAYDAQYLDAVAQRLDWLHEAGFVAVLDMHQDVYGVGFGHNGAPRWTCDEALYATFEPTTPWFLAYLRAEVVECFDRFWKSCALQDAYAAAWAQVAARLHAHPAVVGFDVMNEPYWGSFPMDSFERTRLGPFYARVVERVRAHAPGWVAFLEPAASRNLGVPTSLERFDFPNVVYAPHVYDGSAEAGMGFSPERRLALLEAVAALAVEAEALGAALWIGEYGGYADHDGIAEYMDAVLDGADLAATGAMYWHYGRDNGYGLLRPDGTEKRTLADAIARPFPQRVAGTPEALAFDSATRALTFEWRVDRAVTAPTLIAVPPRVAPADLDVACGDCEVRRVAGGVELGLPPRGERITVTVRPSP